MVLTALVVLAASLIDGVHDEGDAPRVGGAHLPSWLVLKPTPTKHPSHPLQDSRHVRVLGLGTCRPLGSTINSCVYTPLQATCSSTEDVAYSGCLLHRV